MKIKVLHCLETMGSGGVEQRRLLIARYLDKNTFEQHIVCAKTNAGFENKFAEEGVIVSAIGSLKHTFNIAYYKRLLTIVRKVRPHIIHGAVFEGVTSAVVAGMLLRIPVIIVEETSDPLNRSWRGNWLMKIFCSLADYVVGISPSVTNYLRHTVKAHPRKIRLINNGVAVPVRAAREKVEQLKRQLGLQPEDFVVGSVGRLRDFHKRFSDLIRAIALLREKCPSMKLLIVGDGEDREALEKLAVELNVQERVIFAGFQNDTTPYYCMMDVFALASHMEGFGLVVVEAMLFSLPVVVTEVGGLRDIVVEGETGFLVPSHTPMAMAEKLKFFFENKSHRVEMGEKGCIRAHAEFTAEAYVKKVESLYREAITGKEIT
jgi:L-malate glycosyltransferase